MEKAELRNEIKKINDKLSEKGYALDDIQNFWYGVLDEVRTQKINEDMEHIRSIHGFGFSYTLKKGTSVDLTKLNNNQKVCASKIKGHHWLLTEI
mgnify:CR=1 FL=1